MYSLSSKIRAYRFSRLLSWLLTFLPHTLGLFVTPSYGAGSIGLLHFYYECFQITSYARQVRIIFYCNRDIDIDCFLLLKMKNMCSDSKLWQTDQPTSRRTSGFLGKLSLQKPVCPVLEIIIEMLHTDCRMKLTIHLRNKTIQVRYML